MLDQLCFLGKVLFNLAAVFSLYTFACQDVLPQCHLQTLPGAQPLAWGGYSCLLSYLGFFPFLSLSFFFSFFWLLNYTCKSICILNLHTKCKWCDCRYFSCSIFVLCGMNTICTFSESLWAFALLASQIIIMNEMRRILLQGVLNDTVVKP